MKKVIIIGVVFALLALLPAAGALAQEPVECEFEYTVQDGDWLSKIADKYFGDVLAYDQIVEVANAGDNDPYTNIPDPNLIEPGWVICIPSVEDAMATLISAVDANVEAPAGLSPEELANATYQSQYTADGEVTLQNGLYSEPVAPGSATETNVRVTRHLTYGELDGQETAAIVLLSDPGGSGSFYDLHVMAGNRRNPVNIATVFLGDRAQVKFIAIENNQVNVNMIIQGPDDPMCCPSQEVENTYVLQDGTLKLVYSNVIGGLAIEPSQLRLDTQGLSSAWQPSIVTETAYDQSRPPGPKGLPEHIQVNFGGVNPEDRKPNTPIMYIIPVDTYQLLWEKNRNNGVTQMMTSIFDMTVAFPEPLPTSGMPALPYEEFVGSNDLAAQISRINAGDLSAAKNGYRFVGRHGQSPNPVTNQGLRYIYQGFSNDGKYLISFVYPVSTARLPADVASVSPTDMDTFNQNLTTYMQEQTDLLNSFSPADFEPGLQSLDALVASLEIDQMVTVGLHGQQWGMIGRVESNGQQTPLTDIDSQTYTLVYNPDGSLTFQADCNNGMANYTANGGMIGQVATQPGPMTLAECGRGSLSDEMVSTINGAQTYKVWPGGSVLELVKPANGGSLLFGTLGAAETPPPSPPPPPSAEISFWADDDTIKQGDCTTLNWRVTNVDSVWVYPQGEPYENYPMTGEENHQVCPNTTTTFEMRVLLSDGQVEFRQVTVNVDIPPQAEINFWADQTSINRGECTTLRWQTANVSGVWMYPQGQPWDQYPVAGEGEQQVCPEKTSTYELRVLLQDDQVEIRQVTIEVRQPEPQDPLQNTSWDLASMYVNQVPIPNTTITLIFGDDDTLSGSGGCNTYSSSYLLNGSQLSILVPSTTQKTCGDDIDAQEVFYLTTLQSVASFNIDGTQLILKDAGGQEILRYNQTG